MTGMLVMGDIVSKVTSVTHKGSFRCSRMADDPKNNIFEDYLCVQLEKKSKSLTEQHDWIHYREPDLKGRDIALFILPILSGICDKMILDIHYGILPSLRTIQTPSDLEKVEIRLKPAFVKSLTERMTQTFITELDGHKRFCLKDILPAAGEQLPRSEMDRIWQEAKEAWQNDLGIKRTP